MFVAERMTKHPISVTSNATIGDVDRLMKLIKDMVAERKKLFAKAEVFDCSLGRYHRLAVKCEMARSCVYGGYEKDDGGVLGVGEPGAF